MCVRISATHLPNARTWMLGISYTGRHVHPVFFLCADPADIAVNVVLQKVLPCMLVQWSNTVHPICFLAAMEILSNPANNFPKNKRVLDFMVLVVFSFLVHRL